MKLKISTILISSILLLSCTVSKNAPLFKDYGEVDKNSCILYVIRGSGMYGGAVPWALIVKKYNMNSGKFENDFQISSIYQKSYTPLVLKSNTLYSISFGSSILLFSGTSNSQSIFRQAGIKAKAETIKGNSLDCIGNSYGFQFSKEQIKEWAMAIAQAESFTNISVKKSLLDAEFDILIPQKSSPLYDELQTLRMSGNRSSYVDATFNRNY